MKNPLKRFLDWIFQLTGLITLVRFQRASWYDVFFCFRLVLNRRPNLREFRWWVNVTNERQMPIAELLAAFLSSEEYQQLAQERHTPSLVSLPLFDIFVWPDDYLIGAVIARDHIYEPEITLLLQQWLKSGMTFLDIGANIGYFTLLASVLVGETGRIFAFEPAPANVDLLEKSITKNARENITLYPVAVDESESSIPFIASGTSSNGRLDLGNLQRLTNIVVAAKPLNQLMDSLPHIDIIKMDIEGAEPRALRGMSLLLQRDHPTIIFEYSPEQILETSGEDPLNVVSILHDLGYRLFKVNDLAASEVSLEHALNTKDLIQEGEQLRFFEHLNLVALHQNKGEG